MRNEGASRKAFFLLKLVLVQEVMPKLKAKVAM